MSLHLEPVRVAADPEEEGQLVFTDDHRLVAVLTRLSDLHGNLSGRWFLEVGFGRLGETNHPIFTDLDTAQDWTSRRMAKP